MEKLHTYALCAALRAQSAPTPVQRIRPIAEWLCIQANCSPAVEASIDAPAPAPQPAQEPPRHATRPAVPTPRPHSFIREIHASHERVIRQQS